MFAVVYRWKLKKGLEDQFQENWKILTAEFIGKHGGLGSRLHRSEDVWVAYARWPSKEKWQSKKKIESQEAMKLMGEAVEESFPPMELDIIEDRLLG